MHRKKKKISLKWIFFPLLFVVIIAVSILTAVLSRSGDDVLFSYMKEASFPLITVTTAE